MNEAGDKGEGDDTKVNRQKTCIATHPGKKNIAHAGEKSGHDNHRPRAETIDQITDQRSLDGALRSGKREGERRCGSTQTEILADGKKENCETVLMQPASDNPDRRHQPDHPPAVIQAREEFSC
jgi:hypothetical protein